MEARWRRMKEAFEGAVALPEEERSAYLDRACAGDAAVRAQVEELIAAERDAPSFLDGSRHGLDGGGPRAGETVGRYKLLEQIGEGGFGVVFMAEQTEPVVRRVALKIIKLGMDTKRVIARFEAERQALAMMDHPNIARVLDAGATEEGRPYFVMELVRGAPITEYCDGQRLTVRERLELFVRVCRAVQHAHTKGVIHRDIKPSNVLVTLHDGAAAPKIIDFGIAKATNARLTEKTLFTELRMFVGTPAYMSPEQAELSGLDIDTRTDVYSLGVLLYELLTGVTPFDGERLREAGYDEIRRIIREEEPSRPSMRVGQSRRGQRGERDEEFGEGRRESSATREAARHRQAEPATLTRYIRGDLDWIILKTLEKDRDRRYETASALAADIERFLRGEPIEAAPPSRVYRLRKSVRRHRAAIGTGLVIGVTVVAAAAVSTVLAVREASARREAELRGEEARLVGEFQGRMLSQINAAAVGGRLVQDLRDRYEAALEKQGVDESAIPARVEAFEVELARVNSTDAAAALVDRMVIQPAVETIDSDFGDKPQTAATLRHTIVDLYIALGRFSDAFELARENLATRRRVLGNDHPDTLLSVHTMARVLSGLGRTDEAAPLAKEAMEGRRRVLGPRTAQTLTCQSNYGVWMCSDETAEEAERLCRDALAGIRELGDETYVFNAAIHNLAKVLRFRGKVAEVEGLLLEAIEMTRERFGREHPEYISSINEYGDFLFHERRWEESITQSSLALELARKVWGKNHEHSVTAIWNVAFLLRVMGRPAEAEPFMREFRERRRLAYPDDYYWVTVSTKELGAILNELGRHAEAEAVLRDLEPRVLESPEIRNVIEIRSHLGRALLAQGRLDEAETLVRESLNMAKEHSDESSTAPHNARTVLGEILLAQERYPEAEAALREAVSGYTGILGERFTHARVALGEALMGQGRWADAEAVLLKVDEVFPQSLASTPRQHKECVRTIVALYDAWHVSEPAGGYDARAERWRARLATMPDVHPPLPGLPPPQ